MLSGSLWFNLFSGSIFSEAALPDSDCHCELWVGALCPLWPKPGLIAV